MNHELIAFDILDLKTSRFPFSLSELNNIVYNVNTTVNDPPAVWLAGGSIRSVFDKSTINDFDVFFKNEETKDFFREELVEYYGFKSTYQCPKGLLETLMLGRDKVQLVTPDYFDDVKDLLDSFDFTAAQFASDGRNIYTTKQAMRDTYKRNLVLWRITHPISTMRRITKYTNRGYRFSEDQRFLFLDYVARNRWNWDLRWYID